MKRLLAWIRPPKAYYSAQFGGFCVPLRLSLSRTVYQRRPRSREFLCFVTEGSVRTGIPSRCISHPAYTPHFFIPPHHTTTPEGTGNQGWLGLRCNPARSFGIRT